MALKSLAELDREFILDRASHYQNKAYEPMSLNVKGQTLAVVNPPRAAKPSEDIISGSKVVVLPNMGQFKNKNHGDFTRREKPERKARFSLISDMLFYMAILIILLSALPSPNSVFPKAVMGYSYFTVLSTSMQDEIPKGSFVLVRQTDAQNLKKGDNITYMRDGIDTVTHKIVNIYDNYQNSGARGFQTKGVNNATPDKDIVSEKNIVGKVILVLPAAGVVISYLGENIYIVFILFGLCVVLSLVFRTLLVKQGRKTAAEAV